MAKAEAKKKGKRGDVGKHNLIPINKRSLEEQKAIREKAASGRRLQAATTKKKLLKECLTSILESPMQPDIFQRYPELEPIYNAVLEQAPDVMKNFTGAQALSMRLFVEAMSGNVKAFEMIRDTAGQKPVEKQETVATNFVVDLGKKRDDDD